MIDEDLRWAWVAGVLEGEACFHADNMPSASRHYPRISVSSIDEDVLIRLQEWTGAGKIYGPRTPSHRGKQFWVWSVHRKDDALAVMQRVLPLMLGRRAEKINQIITVYKWELENLPLATRAPKTHCRSGHEYTMDNTIITRSGERRCRSCQNRYVRNWRARNIQTEQEVTA